MKRVAIIMDPIESININKDSTHELMLTAKASGFESYYIKPCDLMIKNEKVIAQCCAVNIVENKQQWFELKEQQEMVLSEFDAVFMRLDPPFDMNYIYLTYLLELAQNQGANVINDPRSIRDCNEKLFTTWFPHCCPATIVTSNQGQLNQFLLEQQEIIVKPLDGMGGSSIFYVKQGDLNKNVIFESLTNHGKTLIMAQKFIPEVRQGDKRITLIDGKAVDYAVLRVPRDDDVRANLAAGGHAEVIPLSDRDKWLAEQIGPSLKAKGLRWVGLDVIGDYVTEINVTSPTCIKELPESLVLQPLLQSLQG